MKTKTKIILAIIITMVLSVTGTAVATTIILSKEVSYDNNKSKGSFTNVQDSLDELYARAGYTGEEYHEDILHGADPVLGDELIPVYLADNGDVYYANTHTKWYSYEYKRWANAVILVDDAYGKNREDKKDKYSVGDKIAEEDIESYFVWIPRYAYKLWNLGNYTNIIDVKNLSIDTYDSSPSNILGGARIIDITFGTNEYLSGDDYKRLIRNPENGEFTEPKGLEVDQWLVHPAFTLGAEELNGFWVGKFETGYNQTNSGETSITGTDKWNNNEAQKTEDNSSKIIVKPNVFAWGLNPVSNMFNASKGYNEILKSHMLKNTEWGAVAYLSHSPYGKTGEINVNNAKDLKTGFSSSPIANQKIYPGETGDLKSGSSFPYNSPIGYLASTTGNITGVYDMSGGAWEYVAATMISGVTRDESGFSPETILEQMKLGYIDVYSSGSSTYIYNKRILGDATAELGPFYLYNETNNKKYSHNSWYADNSNFIAPSLPWFDRGGGQNDGVIAGIFNFGHWADGLAINNLGFRLALAP